MEDIINYNNINNGKIMGSTNPSLRGVLCTRKFDWILKI